MSFSSTSFRPVVPMKASPFSESTLFIGDLSYLCNETTLFELFQPFGAIENIQLKKSEHDLQKNHIGYGFLTFSTVQAAANALHEMNGKLVLGRSIRVGWANANANGNAQPSAKGYAQRSNSPTSILYSSSPPSGLVSGLEQARRSKASIPTVQVHVSFTASLSHDPVTELTLRNIFQQFGEVIDTSIKKVYLKDMQGVQSGYGFVHFRLNQEGIQSALTSIQEINRSTIDFVFYECKETHELKAQLASLNHAIPIANRTTALPAKRLPQESLPLPLLHKPYNNYQNTNKASYQPHYPPQQPYQNYGSSSRFSPTQHSSSLSNIFTSSSFFSTLSPELQHSEEVKSEPEPLDDFLQKITNYCLASQSKTVPFDPVVDEDMNSLSLQSLGNNSFTSSGYDCASLIESLISTN